MIRCRGKSVQNLIVRGLGSLLLGAGSNFLLQITLARLLGVDGYGGYMYVYTWAIVCSLFIKMGFDVSALRFVASYLEQGRNDLVGGFIRFAIFVVASAGILTAIVWTFTVNRWQFGNPEIRLESLFYIATVMIFTIALMEIEGSILRGAGYVISALLPHNTVFPLSMVVVVSAGHLIIGGQLTAQQAMTMACLLSSIVVIVQGVRIGRRLMKSEEPTIWLRRIWFSASIAMGVSTGARIMIRQADILFVGALCGVEKAGLYAVATRIMRFARFGQRASNAVIGPVFSKEYTRRDRLALQRVTSSSLRTTLLFSLPVFLLIALGSDLILDIFGKPFEEAKTVLFILLAGEMVNVVSGPNAMLLDMAEKQNQIMKITLSVMCFHLVMLYFLVHRYGMLGAGFASMVAVMLQNAAAVLSVRRHLGVNSTVFCKHLWRISQLEE